MSQQFDFSKLEGETEDDYMYRMLGSCITWIYQVQNSDTLPQDKVVRHIWNMYINIKNMPIDQLEDIYFDNIYSDEYRSHDKGGAWCRTWCRLAQEEIRLREESENEDLDDGIIEDD
jgi:hypothetical protein